MNSSRADPSYDEFYNAWSDGDDVAGCALVALLSSPLRRYFTARRIEDSDDLVQETFRRLFASHGQYRGGGTRSYLFGIARIVLLEHLAAQRRHARVSPLGEISDFSPWCLATALATRDDHRRLAAALASLPEGDRQMLDLFYWQGLKSREIAAEYDIPEPTARGRLATARKRLIGRM